MESGEMRKGGKERGIRVRRDVKYSEGERHEKRGEIGSSGKGLEIEEWKECGRG